MNFNKLLNDLDGCPNDCAETFAASIVNEVSEWAAINGYPDLVRDPTPAARVVEVRRYIAACIAATRTQKPETNDEFLTIKQVAEKLQLSERSVARLVERGLVVSKMGKSVRIKPEDLERYLSDQETVFD